ncbi:MAG: C40 family peptidase [Hylemonella sp.]|nr:C40 family peptidase [Hylemonella sp.]
MRLQSLVFLLTVLIGTRAAANGPGDDLDRFLSARGLLDQPVRTQTAPAAQAAPLAPLAATAAPLPNTSAEDGTQRMSGLVVAAMGALGVPYQRGGNGYESGFDCSGFVRALYQQNFGLLLPRRAAEQAAVTQPIAREELKPGDLVFFNTLNRAFSHVGIYVGDHRFIHSPRSGAVVRIEDMRVNYWSRRFEGARRAVGQTTASFGPPPTVSSSLNYTSH